MVHRAMLSFLRRQLGRPHVEISPDLPGFDDCVADVCGGKFGVLVAEALPVPPASGSGYALFPINRTVRRSPWLLWPRPVGNAASDGGARGPRPRVWSRKGPRSARRTRSSSKGKTYVAIDTNDRRRVRGDGSALAPGEAELAPRRPSDGEHFAGVARRDAKTSFVAGAPLAFNSPGAAPRLHLARERPEDERWARCAGTYAPGPACSGGNAQRDGDGLSLRHQEGGGQRFPPFDSVITVTAAMVGS